MQDEHFIREWNQVHEDFTADVHNTLGPIRRTRGNDLCTIGPAYDLPVEPDARPALPPAAQASLRGLAASVITLALWVIVMLVATPAPGLAAAEHAPATHSPACTASAKLA